VNAPLYDEWYMSELGSEFRPNEGENLIISGGDGFDFINLDSWEVSCWNENSAYVYKEDIESFGIDRFTCPSSGPDYTQLIWAKSEKVGCGYVLMADADDYHIGYLVCHYSPAGNVEDAPVAVGYSYCPTGTTKNDATAVYPNYPALCKKSTNSSPSKITSAAWPDWTEDTSVTRLLEDSYDLYDEEPETINNVSITYF